MSNPRTIAEESKAWDIQDWRRIFDSINDPDILAEKQRRAKVKLRQDERVRDTGLLP